MNYNICGYIQSSFLSFNKWNEEEKCDPVVQTSSDITDKKRLVNCECGKWILEMRDTWTWICPCGKICLVDTLIDMSILK